MKLDALAIVYKLSGSEISMGSLILIASIGRQRLSQLGWTQETGEQLFPSDDRGENQPLSYRRRLTIKV